MRTSGSNQLVKMLTEYALAITASRFSNSASHGRPVKTSWRTSNVGTVASSTRITTPRAPSATTDPGKSASPRRSVSTSPEAVMSSSPTTSPASERVPSPEPWVPVATAPATEMCGREAMAVSARPRACRSAATSP